ncbi:Trehalose-6-P synthase/phosphatase complex synthase subunit [Allomyces arbusculus]|nr:Trehalose-6-P synthase/phosphatase complex synthase subunit [Allomyces arbusculus]
MGIITVLRRLSLSSSARSSSGNSRRRRSSSGDPASRARARSPLSVSSSSPDVLASTDENTGNGSSSPRTPSSTMAPVPEVVANDGKHVRADASCPQPTDTPASPAPTPTPHAVPEATPATPAPAPAPEAALAAVSAPVPTDTEPVPAVVAPTNGVASSQAVIEKDLPAPATTTLLPVPTSATTPAATTSELANGARLLVVSNRLPVTLAQDATTGSWTARMSSGGLVSALSGLKKDMAFTWIGWPGKDFPADDQVRIADMLARVHRCVPVFLPDDIADAHYNGFSNSILWPLFHYHPGDMAFNEAHWAAYHAANMAFADAIMATLQDGDIVWVHDYHLMLLPQMLRLQCDARGLRNVKIGFFLHTPFPTSEVYRILPVRREMLLGLLQCDLVGFHTYDYARHFLSSCTQILGLATMPNGVDHEGRFVHVGAFPIGIDPDQFVAALDTDAVRERVAHLRERFAGTKVIVGVDRLDYIKGVPHKLHALKVFLDAHPEWIGKVVLIQVAVPSRSDVDEYQHLRATVNELVGRINGEYGTVEAMPIHYLHQSVSFTELVALYAVADVCVVSSTRDGMNLVSYEYIAAQRDAHGVLIMSEFAGAAQSLNGALLVNPWNTEELADAYAAALAMPATDRANNHAKLFRYVAKHTAAYWGHSFVHELLRFTDANGPSAARHPAKLAPARFLANVAPPAANDRAPSPTASHFSSTTATNGGGPDPLRSAVLRAFVSAPQRVLFLDQGGTLASEHLRPEFSAPPPNVIAALRELAAVPNTAIYIVSGRARRHLAAWYADVAVGLSAEHGCFYRHARDSGIESKSGETDADGWVALAHHVDLAWRDTVRPLFDHYTERTPGSYVEDKEVAFTWNYRDTDAEFGAWQANELQVNVEKMLSHLPVSIIPGGNKTLELRPSAIDKASAVRAILADVGAKPGAFVMSVGNGMSDEAVFACVANAAKDAVTVTVGKKSSAAKFYVDGISDVHALLDALVVAAKDPALVADDDDDAPVCSAVVGKAGHDVPAVPELPALATAE